MEPIIGEGEVRLGFERATGVATLTLAATDGVNVLRASFVAALERAVRALRGLEGLCGVLVESAHRPWCAGADLDELWQVRDPARLRALVGTLHGVLRALETCGAPVVAVLDGAALGGGYELALACHRRVAVDRRDVRVGLPEVSLGVIPGAGGTQRLPRLVGLTTALDVILGGRVLPVAEARAAGLIDDTAADLEQARESAHAWLATKPPPTQPWDRPGAPAPAPAPGSTEARDLLVGASARVIKRTAGALQAPQVALNAVGEGTRLTLDAGLAVESAWFVRQLTGAEAHAMLRTLWFHKRAAERHEGLPRATGAAVHRVAVLGAGMMGAGLAYLAASKGLEVVLKDVSEAALQRGMAHVRAQADARAAKGGEAAEAVAGRVTGTLDAAALAGTDLAIEAVFEDADLKRRVTREAAPFLAADGLWASNTSALPIGELADGYGAPERFLGLHFFSPVEVMPLVEVVRGAATSDATVGRALAFCRALGKTPIVVNDGWGFYTTRVFAAYILEGASLVAEGHDPAVVEWAARAAGMPVGPLQVFDEVSLTLGEHVLTQRAHYRDEGADLPGAALVARLIHEHDRKGRACGRGFYDYVEGKRRGLWSGLVAPAGGRALVRDEAAARERLLYAQAAEAVRALEEGVVRHVRDADLGAVLGVGFAPNLGGPLTWLDAVGAARAVADLERLAVSAGPRYEPPRLLREMAGAGGSFYPGEAPDGHARTPA